MSEVEGVVFTERSARRITNAVHKVEAQATRIERAPIVPGVLCAVPMVVSAESHDYITCHTWDGDSAGSADIVVAKPYLLRKTPMDGVERDGYTYSWSGVATRTSTKTSDSSTEVQYITPSYVAASATYDGDIIYAILCALHLEIDGEQVMYVDANLDGRMWSK